MILSAERMIIDGRTRADLGLRIAEGRIEAVDSLRKLGPPDVHLAGRVLLAGMVNAHSHAFQRLLRGRTQVAGPRADNFWSWREAMYRVAQALVPDALYVAARQAFVEMLLGGITTVGEFHYLHHQPDGTPYDDPIAMSDALLRAAEHSGIRLCVLDTLYMRGDFDRPAKGTQRRFCDASLDAGAERVGMLARRMAGSDRLSWGVAAHSLRAVPIDAVVGMKARFASVPMHIHVSEQRRDVEACVQAHGTRPVQLLGGAGVLDATTTLVHATHITPAEAELAAHQGSLVCVCPSTEADLGDGLTPASELHGLGVGLCLGTDGQTLSSLLAEARRLEMHERLRLERRNLFATREGDAVAATLLRAASETGAASLGLRAGRIAPGYAADLVSYDLADPALTGSGDESLPASLVFSADSRALRDVMVGGHFVVQNGVHPSAGESAHGFNALSASIFAN